MHFRQLFAEDSMRRVTKTYPVIESSRQVAFLGGTAGADALGRGRVAGPARGPVTGNEKAAIFSTIRAGGASPARR